jgi:hypothetical protein
MVKTLRILFVTLFSFIINGCVVVENTRVPDKIEELIQVSQEGTYCIIPVWVVAPFFNNDTAPSNYEVRQCIFVTGSEILNISTLIDSYSRTGVITPSMSIGKHIYMAGLYIINDNNTLWVSVIANPDSVRWGDVTRITLSRAVRDELLTDIKARVISLPQKKKGSFWKIGLYGYGEVCIKLSDDDIQLLEEFLKNEVLGRSSNQN